MCLLSALQNAVPCRSLSPARVCVTLRELSVCREWRPALLSALLQTARLFPDACDTTRCFCFTWSLQAPSYHPPEQQAALGGGVNVYVNVSVHLYVCVCVSSHLHSCREHVKWAKNNWWAARLPSWNTVWKEKWGSIISSNFIQEAFWLRKVFLNLQFLHLMVKQWTCPPSAIHAEHFIIKLASQIYQYLSLHQRKTTNKN